MAVVWLAGPAPGQEPPSRPAVTSATRSYWPPENPRELLAVDEPMRRFFAARVAKNFSDGETLRQIVAVILDPEGLGFTYEAVGTYDARETFRRRRGNCQGFSFLVVAVARELGLKVQFQDLEAHQRWNRFDRFLAAIRHTNVYMTSYYGNRYVVDLRPDLGQASFVSKRYIVNDNRAFAHFYSTAGFFRLVEGDQAGALRLMQLGTEVDPRSAIAWSNLGNLHLQRGEPALARSCFEKALRLDGRMEEALTGLVRVLRLGGPAEQELADQHERRVQAYRERNPYYAYQLGSQARARGDMAGAEQRLRQAIRLKGDEPLFLEELVALLRQAGREGEARVVEEKLARLRKRFAQVEPHVVP